jgi:hypothetical protein
MAPTNATITPTRKLMSDDPERPRTAILDDDGEVARPKRGATGEHLRERERCLAEERDRPPGAVPAGRHAPAEAREPRRARDRWARLFADGVREGEESPGAHGKPIDCN